MHWEWLPSIRNAAPVSAIAILTVYFSPLLAPHFFIERSPHTPHRQIGVPLSCREPLVHLIPQSKALRLAFGTGAGSGVTLEVSLPAQYAPGNMPPPECRKSSPISFPFAFTLQYMLFMTDFHMAEVLMTVFQKMCLVWVFPLLWLLMAINICHYCKCVYSPFFLPVRRMKGGY